MQDASRFNFFVSMIEDILMFGGNLSDGLRPVWADLNPWSPESDDEGKRPSPAFARDEDEEGDLDEEEDEDEEDDLDDEDLDEDLDDEFEDDLEDDFDDLDDEDLDDDFDDFDEEDEDEEDEDEDEDDELDDV